MPETTRGELTRITVNLTPNAKTALDEAMKSTGDNMTDTINRAVQLYTYVVNRGDQLALYTMQDDGTYQRIIIL